MKFFTRIKILVESLRLTANYPGKEIENGILFTLRQLPPNESVNLTTLHAAMDDFGLKFDPTHVLIAVDALYTRGEIEVERRQDTSFIRMSPELREKFDKLTPAYPGKEVERGVLFTLNYLPPNELINLTTLHTAMAAMDDFDFKFDFGHVLVAVDALHARGDIEVERRQEIPFIRMSPQLRTRFDELMAAKEAERAKQGKAT